MQKTPKGLRLHIAIFGRRNVGKSSILNAITHQEVSIVSEVAGTTADPVEKPMELPPIGPVLFIDTAGLDDLGALGNLRIKKTYKIFERADIFLLVAEAGKWGEYEEVILEEARKREAPILVILNKIDQFKSGQKDGLKRQQGTKCPQGEKLNKEKIPFIETCALNFCWELTAKVKNAVIKLLPDDWINPIPVISDLIKKEDLVILVIPIDKEAPKGRLILPQQQTIREILDKKATCLITNEKDLPSSIRNLKQEPKMVVTDSQVFKEALSLTPQDVGVTSFSILLARSKGDLTELICGTQKLGELKPQDKILIAEACTHHPIGDDIGRVKIPGWISQRIGGKINFDIFSGHDFPPNLNQYKLIIHCGGCMLNRKEILSRIYQAKAQNIPITNYGMAIAYLHDGLERALEPFKNAGAVT